MAIAEGFPGAGPRQVRIAENLEEGAGVRLSRDHAMSAWRRMGTLSRVSPPPRALAPTHRPGSPTLEFSDPRLVSATRTTVGPVG